MFKLIPGSSNFYINENGIVKDYLNNIKNTYINGDGYITVAIKLKNNNWQTFGVHRLLALTFIDNNDCKDIVNHIDGIKTNNGLNNLEWCTVKENNIHAAIINSTNLNPGLIAENLNSVILLSNLNHAAEYFNLTIKEIWNCVKESKKIDNWVIKHYGNADNIPKNYHKDRRSLNNIRRGLNVLDIINNDVLYFKSQHEAARYFNVNAGHINICINRNKNLTVFLKRYIIVFEGDEIANYSNKELENKLRHRGCSVLAFNVLDKNFYIYKTAKKFILDNQLSKKTVSVNLFKNNIKLTDNWLYIYLTNENELKLKAFIECPDSLKAQPRKPKR
jgi:hypothetical protein